MLNHKGTKNTKKSLLIAVAASLLALAPGCIAHGDAVAQLSIRGQLREASNRQPLADANVAVSAYPTGLANRDAAETVLTDADGRFVATTWVGAGSVTWFIIPVYFRMAAPIESVYLSVSHQNRTTIETIQLSRPKRIASGKQNIVDLGTVNVEFRERQQ